MNDLVIMNNGIPVTTTLAIAEGSGNEHASVIFLVRKYQADLRAFGEVQFQIEPRKKGRHGGGEVEYAILNERQAILFITYMRNGEAARKFKKDLINRFDEINQSLNHTAGDCMSTELVIVDNDIPVTTSEIIAEGTKVQHKNVLELIRTYLVDLEEFGGVAFITRTLDTNGGTQSREIAILNERQATLLISYMRNSEIVRTFKKRLVKKFYEMAEQLKNPQVPNNDSLYEPRHPSLDDELHNLRRKRVEKELELIDLDIERLSRRHVDTPVIKAPSTSNKSKWDISSPPRFPMAMQEASVRLGMKPNALFEVMREEGILRDVVGPYRNTPTKEWANSGFFHVREKIHTMTTGKEVTQRRTFLTREGYDFLLKECEND